jgi:hypothetical protein
VIARHDEDWHAAFCYASQRLERLVRETRRHIRSIKHVTAMHDGIDLACQRRLERSCVVREEVVPAAPAFDARSRRQIEAEVGVSEEQNPDAGGHPNILVASVFLR